MQRLAKILGVAPTGQDLRSGAYTDRDSSTSAPDDKRERVIAEVRRLLRELLGVEGDVTVDVAFRADAWRSRRHN